ncbi:flagellar hook-basal body protein [Bacillus testis]|uniref:flagellar hook-basal body protein n=1 Tax=Bacillus testis TaxID=1622072 RepID=UPI00067EDDB6|nr:flagellar hook-basal body protein [Bacillus testis]
MNQSMITATNTLSQLQQRIDLIGTNMANADTTGYKRKDATFNDLLVQQIHNQNRTDKEIGRKTPMGIRQGSGSQLALEKLVMTQGSLKETGRNLDVALLKEDQFFKIQVVENNKNDVQYTRDGAFYLSPTKTGSMNLVTSGGYHVLDANNKPVTIPADMKGISFGEAGVLRIEKQDGSTAEIPMGVVSVKNAQYLEHKSGNLVGLSENAAALGIEPANIMTELTGNERNGIAMKQGALESSNVDLSKEITDLLIAQRQYQMQSRSITMADEMQGLINSVR